MQLRSSTDGTAADGSAGRDATADPPDPSGGDRPGRDAQHAAPRRTRWSRHTLWLVVLGLLVVVVAVLALLIRPLLVAKQDAQAAQAELTTAKTALSNHDYPTARAAIASAQGHVESAQSSANGFGSDIWSHVPVASGAVHDERYLVDALAETVQVAQIGSQIYPMLSGQSGQLVQGEQIDLTLLQKVLSQTRTIGPHLHQAIADLRQVSGSTPLVGGTVGRARDSALAQLTPVKQGYEQSMPLLRSLPSILGANGPRNYLVAMLNPSELRYSGGAALSYTTISFTNGYAVFGATLDVNSIIMAGPYLHWHHVPGNPFHPLVKTRLTSATFSPWWSVSGPELMGAFHAAYKSQLNGVIVIDLQALAKLFAVTGPVKVAEFGTFTSDNLVQRLANSYTKYPTAARHRLNYGLVARFRDLMLGSGDVTAKGQAILDSAKGRHFAAYFRDPAIEARFEKVGLTGDLSSTPNDYVGVFSQNTNGSKVDYFQHRTLSSKVRLHADGSASVDLRIKVKNQSPPYAKQPPDPRTGYYTSYLGASLGVFLPSGARIQHATVNGNPFVPQVGTPAVKGVYNRSYFAHRMMIPSSGTRVFEVHYRVPHAATKAADGSLTYRLDVDPQDTVVPERFNVSVTWPAGLAPTTLPAGWGSSGPQTASYGARLDQAISFDIPLLAH